MYLSHVYIVKLSLHERMQLSNNENKKPTPAFVYNDLDAILKIWKRYFNFHFFVCLFCFVFVLSLRW